MFNWLFMQFLNYVGVWEQLIVIKLTSLQLWIFFGMILESLDSWLNSKIPDLILVIAIYKIKACASHDL